MTDEQRRMTREEQDLKRIREAGVEAYRIPDERLPGRSAGTGTNEQRIMEEMRAGARELGVDLEVGRIPDEDLPGRSKTKTNTERAIERIRKAVVEYGGDVRVGRIPDEDLPKGRTRIPFFGEARRRAPKIGERVEVRVGDGSWHAGYRAITGPVDAREVPEEHLKAAGADPAGEVVWITDEERWTAATEANRGPDGMPWPVEQLRVAPPVPEG